jgi:hypothetical protein
MHHHVFGAGEVIPCLPSNVCEISGVVPPRDSEEIGPSFSCERH